MAHLEVHTKAGVKRCNLGASKLTIGRHASNSVTISDDKLISRHHCQIEFSNTGYVLRDLDSRNGTKIDGLDIVSVVLRSGTEFLVGDTTFKFIDDGQTVQVAAGQLPHADPSQPRGVSSDTMAGLDEAIEVEEGTPVLLEEDEPGPGGRYGIGSFTALLKVGRDVPYGLSDIALINARGKVVHSATGRETRSRDATAEAIDIIRLLLLGCIRSGASDIHMEPQQDGLGQPHHRSQVLILPRLRQVSPGVVQAQLRSQPEQGRVAGTLIGLGVQGQGLNLPTVGNDLFAQVEAGVEVHQDSTVLEQRGELRQRVNLPAPGIDQGEAGEKGLLLEGGLHLGGA